jgi:hypothetical protein
LRTAGRPNDKMSEIPKKQNIQTAPSVSQQRKKFHCEGSSN